MNLHFVGLRRGGVGMSKQHQGKIFEEFKAHMRYLNVSQREVAEAIGITVESFNLKVNGRYNARFTLPELNAIGHFLNLSADQILEFFFSDFVE